MAYKIKSNEVAFVRATDEPVFVLNIASEEHVEVRRVVKTDGNAAVYGNDVFMVAELCSPKARLVNALETMKFEAEMREKYSNEYQMSHRGMPATPQADGDISLPN